MSHMLPRLAIAAVAAIALASCQSSGDAKPKVEPPRDLFARLASTGGSAAFGSVQFHPVDGGVRAMINVWPGTAGSFRAVIHTGGLCNSPNGFSAGPPFVPTGFSGPIEVPFSAGTNAQGTTIVKIPNLTFEGPNGIFGKSVVIHMGALSSLEATPGVPNNRIACGVIELAPKPWEF